MVIFSSYRGRYCIFLRISLKVYLRIDKLRLCPSVWSVDRKCLQGLYVLLIQLCRDVWSVKEVGCRALQIHLVSAGQIHIPFEAAKARIFTHLRYKPVVLWCLVISPAHEVRHCRILLD